MLVGLESASANLADPAGIIDQLSTLRRPSGLKLVIEPLVTEITFVVCNPFLKPSMGLDNEFRHKSLLN
jgi:hypothetical protein